MFLVLFLISKKNGSKLLNTLITFILKLTFLLHVTNKQTTSIVKTIPVETPVMMTTREFVEGVISNVDLLPVTALESVTPEKFIRS